MYNRGINNKQGDKGMKLRNKNTGDVYNLEGVGISWYDDNWEEVE